MRRMILMALPVLLSACEGGGDPVNQAVREISAKYQAEAVREGTVSAPSSAVPADTAEQAAIRQMIAHNDEAIAAARQVLATSQDIKLRSLAEQTIANRTRENADLSSGLITSEREPASR